jgi:hypothetical protein
MRYDAKEVYAAVSNARPTSIGPLSVWEKHYHKRMARSRYTIERGCWGVYNVGWVGLRTGM